MESPEPLKRSIVQYFNAENPDAVVEHAERVASERVYDRTYDVWDVHATDGRWWVITNPTNLYLQADHPRMDSALSFHIGVTTRVFAKQAHQADVSDEERDRLPTTWRRLEQAGEALDHADEPEAFQAVGMRCREALLAFVRDAVSDDLRDSLGSEAPKAADFIHWSERLADQVAPGESATRLRRYLKKTAAATWDLVNWLTHAASATYLDAEIARDATGAALGAFSLAIVRFERGQPDKCPECSSYRLFADYRPEIGAQGSYITICQSCGWTDTPSDEYPLSR
jgi:hypothetical protein